MMVSMKTVTVSEAKARLSELLRRVARGDAVVITSRGKTVARIVPVLAADAGSDEEWLAQMEREGAIIRAKKPPSLDFLKLPKVKLTEERSLLRALLEEREEGR
jgi:prevent-host-death family protein